MGVQTTTDIETRYTQLGARVYTRMSWRHSYWVIALIAVLIGVLSIVANVAMDWAIHGVVRRVLPSDIMDAAAAGVLCGFVLIRMQSHRRSLILRMQVIEDVNHHVRNALECITLSAALCSDQELDAKVTDAYDRIDWVLNDVLPQTINGRDCDAPNLRWRSGRRISSLGRL
jgi:hypothetical protein